MVRPVKFRYAPRLARTGNAKCSHLPEPSALHLAVEVTRFREATRPRKGLGSAHCRSLTCPCPPASLGPHLQARATSPSPRWGCPTPSSAWGACSCSPPWRCPSTRLTRWAGLQAVRQGMGPLSSLNRGRVLCTSVSVTSLTWPSLAASQRAVCGVRTARNWALWAIVELLSWGPCILLRCAAPCPLPTPPHPSAIRLCTATYKTAAAGVAGADRAQRACLPPGRAHGRLPGVLQVRATGRPRAAEARLCHLLPRHHTCGWRVCRPSMPQAFLPAACRPRRGTVHTLHRLGACASARWTPARRSCRRVQDLRSTPAQPPTPRAGSAGGA